MGISPGGARESSPWREPWEQTRTARSPGGAKEPFHGDSPIAEHEGPSYAPTGLARLWAGPTGLTPWASHRAYAPVSYTHLRAHETRHDLVCRLLLEKK